MRYCGSKLIKNEILLHKSRSLKQIGRYFVEKKRIIAVFIDIAIDIYLAIVTG